MDSMDDPDGALQGWRAHPLGPRWTDCKHECSRGVARSTVARTGFGTRVATTMAALAIGAVGGGMLQKATLAQILAMRQLLRSNQTAAFDQAVVKALTDDQQ
ncbi:hypothetical protein [Sphingomonas sp.]|uniref:hypothetical protein n=1 Tax=Sphingomonas sp. TaxID=28214 RepID=UPI0035BC4968